MAAKKKAKKRSYSKKRAAKKKYSRVYDQAPPPERKGKKPK
jgi:hypothetical protein